MLLNWEAPVFMLGSMSRNNDVFQCFARLGARSGDTQSAEVGSALLPKCHYAHVNRLPAKQSLDLPRLMSQCRASHRHRLGGGITHEKSF
jgi:hypothetical protein